ncbi:MAG: SUMF1/EgtB/PvdO family nonheme iron enzyme, partial [Pseudomonadota bacterium]
VVNVSWNEAQAYVEWLSETTGHRYRLPTEGEWEYAARAGMNTPYYFGADEEELTEVKARASVVGPVPSPVPVNSRRIAPNRFGLMFTAGNVSEWVVSGTDGADPSDAQRVARGGAYDDRDAAALQVTSRRLLASDGRYPNVGLRVVREIP